LNETNVIGSGYGYACGSGNLKTYSYATCDVTVTHHESAIGLVETNETSKINLKPNLNPKRSLNLTLTLPLNVKPKLET